MSVFWATVIGAVIGAAGAIAGGFGAAWWQTSRADDVAEKIRRAERREQGLLALNATLTTVATEFDALYREAERRQSTKQYAKACDLLAQLAYHWYGTAAGMIPDPLIRKRMSALDLASRESLPTSLPEKQFAELANGDVDAGRRFIRDLGHVLGLMNELKEEVNRAVTGLLGTPTRRAGSAAATAPVSCSPRTGVRRRHGRQP